jgi:hypothetical protein
MPNARQALRTVTKGNRYIRAHSVEGKPLSRLSLDKFLDASMDEVRLYWADQYVQDVLHLRDVDDAGHFRHGVMRREVGGEVAYPRQRDHSAHTLNNYLLGWYIFDRIPRVREEFTRHFQLRRARRGQEPEEKVDRGFANVWHWVSLLHDIGYLFEGGVDVRSTGVQDAQIRRGVEVIRDYFQHRFWMEIRFGSFAQRERLLSMTKVTPPEFIDKSLGGVADSLRMLPDLSKLQLAVQRDLKKAGHFIPKVLAEKNGLARDCFDLWAAHYRAYGSDNMAERMKRLDEAFHRLVWGGLPVAGIRVLDHAVCSGLVLLQFSTFYYLLHASLPETAPGNVTDRKIREDFLGRDGIRYKPRQWWTIHTWGTAAAAIHNLVQVSSKWPEAYPKIPKLVLTEDPIAWLGVLVDILEE